MTQRTSTSPATPLAASPSTPRLSRRAFLRLGATLVTGLAVSTCTRAEINLLPAIESRRTGRAAAGQPQPEEIQLVYQDWRTDWFPVMVEEMLAQFHAAHPHIRVFFTPDPDNLAEAMLAEMAAGTAPDVLWGGSTFFPTWAQQGYLLDLRPYVATELAEATLQDWDPVQYRAFFLRDGRQFGLPKYHGAVALYYNKDLFDRYGVAYPTATWNHDDYRAAMRHLSHDNGDGQRELWGSMVDIAWDRLQLHVNSWGGHLIAVDDPTLCVFDRPEALAALEWLRANMWDERIMATFPDVLHMSPRSAFINQRIAMVEEGSWVLKEILRNANFRVGVAPMPSGPQHRVTLATSDGFGIYTGTQYSDAAWALVKFLTSKEYGLAMARADLLQPARISLVDAWIDLVRTEFPEQTRDLDLAVFADGQRQGYSVTVEIADNMAQVGPKVTGALEKIFTVGQAPVTYLQSVCTQVNQLQQQIDPKHYQQAE